MLRHRAVKLGPGSTLPLFLVLVLLAILFTVAGCGTSEGQCALAQAQKLEADSMLTSAGDRYKQAYDLLQEEGLTAEAEEARSAAHKIMMVQFTYPFLETEVREQLAEKYPQIPETEREGWISSGELESFVWDGEVHYMLEAAANIPTRHLEVGYLNTQRSELMAQLVGAMLAMDRKEPNWQPYSNPLRYRGTESVNVPRGELPATGLLKLWFPLPLITAAQDAVAVVSITPDTWLKQPPSLDGPLSCAYFEVPLEELKDDLGITVVFEFTHYQENFVVDPANVGDYDTDSPLYKHYTRSYGNTYISPDIRRTALEVVGDEKNPYLAAKKIYEYILRDIKYSFMPHLTAWPRGERESEYVHRMKRGDCGAQSMYFSALCRSVGIPARTTGGWQLFTGNFGGHFWAEFYLPNYGWLPVDPTAADMADWTDKITEEERTAFKSLYFGNLDPLRCVVQFDVDEAYAPPAGDEVLLPATLQSPSGTLATTWEPIAFVLSEYTDMSAELLSGEPPIVMGDRMH